jgi:hypothetical protein
LNDVYGNTTDTLKLSLYGYYDLVQEITITDQNIDLGTITMLEEFIPAFNVSAVEEGDNAQVSWVEPSSSEKITLINDDPGYLFGYTNEPLENVWMGNKFSNSEAITVTDITMYWADFGFVEPGEVSLEIFDHNQESVAVSNKFVTPADQWITINFPNIPINNDFYVMVHWESVMVSSYFLACTRFDDDPSYNTAVIRFPGEPIQNLNEYLSIEWMFISFLLRPEILIEANSKNGKEVLSYNLYRGFANDILNPEDWEKVNEEPVYETSFTDMDWINAQYGEFYRFAIESVYAEGDAEVSFSSALENTITTGIQDHNSDAITVFPNPCSDFINIKCNTSITNLTVYNSKGNIVFDEAIDKTTFNMNTKQLNPGIYLFRVNTYNYYTVRQVIVK